VFVSAPESSSCLPGVLLGSWTFLAMRWMTPGMIPGEVASQCLYLAVKPSHMGVEVDGLAYPLHRPMTCSYHPRGQGLPARRRPILML
jgi:hypothetical protein